MQRHWSMKRKWHEKRSQEGNENKDAQLEKVNWDWVGGAAGGHADSDISELEDWISQQN